MAISGVKWCFPYLRLSPEKGGSGLAHVGGPGLAFLGFLGVWGFCVFGVFAFLCFWCFLCFCDVVWCCGGVVLFLSFILFMFYVMLMLML